MSTNRIKVHRKEIVKASVYKGYLLIAAIMVGLLAVAVFLTFRNFSVGSVFFSEGFEIVQEGSRRKFRVPSGGNLQAAINRAESGDVIELDANGIYYEISLPKKNLTDFITIQSSAVNQLPENIRVSPNQARFMAKIVTRGQGKPAVVTESGAHHYRFIGIEFSPSNQDYIYNLVYLGTDSKKLEDVPHNFEFDRCYFRSLPEGVTRRGLGLNSANTIVKNSYFQGFAYPQQETQGICGWSGTKNVKIINNYIEGGAENVMFGGSPPATPAHIPTNIEIRHNLMRKIPEWRGKFTTKTLLELKEAKQVQIVGNFFESNVEGSAFRLTVRNDEGQSPEATIEDVLIKNNIFKGSGDGINILGKDDAYPSQTMKRVKIVNNLFLDIGSEKWLGSGYFIQISDGEDIEVSNNTVFQSGNIIKAHGTAPKKFVFRDNIVGYGTYGLHHELKNVNVNAVTYFADIMRNNVVVNNQNLPASYLYIPPNNFKVANFKEVGFADFNGKNFSLSANSKFKGKGTGNKDIGVNMDEIIREMPKELFNRIFQ
jgi:hypothetical protein